MEEQKNINVEILINYIKKRPLMYIGELNFDYLHHYLNGFLYYSFSIEASPIDRIFHKEIHNWARKWIEKKKNILFDQSMGYDFYIRSVCKTEQECFDLFFELCDIFFKEIHDRIDNVE